MAVNQVILSRHAHIDIMMTSQVVRTLEEKGLLTRTVHPADTRAKMVLLTAEGREVAQRALTVVETVDEQFFQELGGQVSTLLRLMQQLIGAHAEVALVRFDRTGERKDENEVEQG